MSLAVSQSPACLPDQTSIDVDLTDDPIIAGNNSSKKKAKEPKPAGHEDSTTASTWDAGISTQATPSSKRTRSSNVQLQSVRVDNDDSDDAVNTTGNTGKRGGSSTNTNAATAAQQMTQNSPASTSALPHTSQRVQACVNTWNNIPYKNTTLACTLIAAAAGISNYGVYMLAKPLMNTQNDQYNFAAFIASLVATQLFIARGAIVAYKMYQDKY
jgi:hypothetical protein